MRYFSQIPRTEYLDLETESNNVLLTNIMKRSGFLKEITNNSAVFYEYQIKEGDTPESIAHKLYGSHERFWIVLLFNQLMNPYYDFPMNRTTLETWIEEKYSLTLAQTMTTIHHYERVIERTVQFNGVIQTTETKVHIISEQELSNWESLGDTPSLPGTADTSIQYETTTESFGDGITVVTTYTNKAVSTFTYESEENEKRRSIKLLDKDYVIRVEQELQRLMRNG